MKNPSIQNSFLAACILVVFLVGYCWLLKEVLEVSYGFGNFPFQRLTPEAAAMQSLRNVLKWMLPFAVLLHIVLGFAMHFICKTKMVVITAAISLGLYCSILAVATSHYHHQFLEKEKTKANKNYSTFILNSILQNKTT